ncbi:MAG: DUF3108 domain-containing protein [Muribaculaceae bacterium]|nr:DUF3108 domain-containing protein [Muribaculaceae bacterium]
MKSLRFNRWLCAVACAAASLGWLCGQARTYTSETLNYQIVYQWGMVWKHAGDATLSIRRSGDGYNAQLVGRTRSWADKVYPVRDTLKCTMNSQMAPLRYEKLTHEKDYYARDVLQFSYNYSHTSATATRYRKSGTSTATLSAKCQAYDMVSVFYMLRNIDFSAMQRGKAQTTVIFSGKEKEYLTIRYQGTENVKLRDGSKRQAYHITFKFTQEAGKKSSDDLDAWLSTDADRIPLLLVGKLPVGQVKCYYTK